ncbi:hypothetical protein PspLS_07779 [Pyricularia sp. CBS 133598]|nr:hypothetical protein PspLS_07779 [Pyricularia sp. CBS 133598]
MACPIPSDQIRQNLERSAREKGFGSPFQLGGPYKPGSHIENPTVGNGDLKHPEPGFYFACPQNKSYIFSAAKKKGHGGHGGPSGIRLQNGFLPYRDITADTSEHTWHRAAQLQKTHPDICKKVNKRPKEWEDLYEYFDGEDIYQMGAYNAWCVVNLLYEMNLHISEDIEAEWKKLMDLALYEWLANFDDAKEKLLAFDRHKTTTSILTVLDDASNVFDLDALTRNQKAILAIRTGLLREKLLAESTENNSLTVTTQPKPNLQAPEATHDHHVDMPLSAPPAVSYFQTQSARPQSSHMPASTPVVSSTPSSEPESGFKEETKGNKSDYPKTPEHGRFQSRSNHVSPTKIPQHRQPAPAAPVPVLFGSHSPDKGDQRGHMPAPPLPLQRGASVPFGIQPQQFPAAIPQGYQGPQMQPPPVVPDQNYRVRFHPSSFADNNQSCNNNNSQQQARSRHAQQPSNGNMSRRSRNSSTSPQKNGTWEPRDVPNSIHGPVVCRPGSRRDSTCQDGGSNLSHNSETRHASSSVLEDRQNLPNGQNNCHHHKQQPCANFGRPPYEPSIKCECRACCERSRSVIVYFDKESVAESQLEDLRRIFSHWGQIEQSYILSKRYHHQPQKDVALVRYFSDLVPPTVLRDMIPSRPCRLGNSIVRVRHPKGSKHFFGFQISPTRRRNSVANGGAACESRPSHQHSVQGNSSMPPPSWPINNKQINGNGPNQGRHSKKPAHVGQLTLGRDRQQPQYGNTGPGQTGLPTPPLSANLSMPVPPVQASMHNIAGLPYQMAPLPNGMSTYAHNQPPFNSVTTYPLTTTGPLPGQATFAYHIQPAPHSLPQQAGPFLGLPAPPVVPTVPMVAAVPGPGLPAKPIVVASANVGHKVTSQTGKDTRHSSITVSREGSPKKQLPRNKVQPHVASSSMTKQEPAGKGKGEATKTNEPKKIPKAIVTELNDNADSGSSTANSSFVILTPNSSFNSASAENSPSRTQLEPEVPEGGVIDYGTVRIRIKKNVGPSSLFNEWMASAVNDAGALEKMAVQPSAHAKQGEVVAVSTNNSKVEGLQEANGRSLTPMDEKLRNPALKSGGGEHIPATANATGTPLAGDHGQHDMPQMQSGPKKGKNKKKNKAKQQQGQEGTATSSIADRSEAHFAVDGNQNHGQETGVQQGHDGQEKKLWKKNKRSNPKKTFQVPSERSDGSRTMSLVSGPSGRVTPEPAAHDKQAGDTAGEAKPAANNEPPSPPQQTTDLAVTKTRAGREGTATLDHGNIPLIAPPLDQTVPENSPFASQKDEIVRRLSDREPVVPSVMSKPPPKLMITQTSRSSTLPAGFDPFPRPLRTATPNASTVADKNDQRNLPQPPPARELTPPATPKKETSSSDPPPVQADRVELPPSPPVPSSRQPSFNPNAQVFVSGGPRQPPQFPQSAASQPVEQQEPKKFQKKKKKPARKPQKQQQNQQEKPAAPSTSNEFVNSSNWRATSQAANAQKADGVSKTQEAAKPQDATAAVQPSTGNRNRNRNVDRPTTPSTPPEPAYKKGDKVDVSKGETFLKHRFNVMSELKGRPQKEDWSSRLASSAFTSAPAQAAESSALSFAAKAQNSHNNKQPIPPPESYFAWPSLPSRPVADQQDASSLTPKGGGFNRDGEKKASSPVSSEKSASTAADDAKGSKGAMSTALSLKLSQHKTRAMSSAN